MYIYIHAVHPDCLKVDHQISPEIPRIITIIHESATFNRRKSVEDLEQATSP